MNDKQKINELTDLLNKERKQFKKELQNLKLYYEEMIALMPGNIYWMDKNNTFLGCNDTQANNAQLKSREEIKGKTNYDMPWKEQAAELNRINNLVIESGKPIITEEHAMMAQDYRTYLTHKVPLKNDNDEIIGVLGISFDITERKKMEEELREAKIAAEAGNRAKTEFIANMSHDIRTPLSGLIGLSKILEESTHTSEEKQSAHWINESGTQLLNLLNGILDVVRNDQVNSDDLHEESFDLYRCIEDIKQLEIPTVKLKQLEFKIDIAQDVPRYVISDRTKIHRTLLNLVGNSIKFTDKGYIGIIIKVVGRSKDHIELEFKVQDTGIGIPKEAQDKVFKRFFRIQSSHQGFKGHGLGLHIAQSYVELLGGKIDLTSESGQGTTFYFRLKLKIGESPHESIPIITKPLPASHNATSPDDTPYILLVEDNVIQQHLGELTMKKGNYRYQCVDQAEKALDLIKSNSFDLILTDLGLPGISGLELTHAIRAWEKATQRSSTLIIGLTAQALPDAKKDCLAAGMNDVLLKPITLEALQETIDQWISSSRINSTPQRSAPRDIGVLTKAEPLRSDELFQLDPLPLLDAEMGVKMLGNEETLKQMLQLLLDSSLNQDEIEIKKAYSEKNWKQVEKLAHKMKSGAAYCGVIKMQRACQNLEHYLKTNGSELLLLQSLYQQLIVVLGETQQHIEQWLALHP